MSNIVLHRKCTAILSLEQRNAGIPRNRSFAAKTSQECSWEQRLLSCFATLREVSLLLLFLLLLFLLKLLFLLNGSSLFSLLTLGSLGISSLLAGPLAEPLGRPLGPLFVLLLPDGVQGLGTDDLPATLVQLLPVLVGPCVGPPLVLGVHADGRRVFSAEGLG